MLTDAGGEPWHEIISPTPRAEKEIGAATFQILTIRVGEGMSVMVWLPRHTRESLDLLRRPGLTALERTLAASIVVTDLKRLLARGGVTETYLALVHDEIRRRLVDGDDLESERNE